MINCRVSTTKLFIILRSISVNDGQLLLIFYCAISINSVKDFHQPSTAIINLSTNINHIVSNIVLHYIFQDFHIFLTFFPWGFFDLKVALNILASDALALGCTFLSCTMAFTIFFHATALLTPTPCTEDAFRQILYSRINLITTVSARTLRRTRPIGSKAITIIFLALSFGARTFNNFFRVDRFSLFYSRFRLFWGWEKVGEVGFIIILDWLLLVENRLHNQLVIQISRPNIMRRKVILINQHQ